MEDKACIDPYNFMTDFIFGTDLMLESVEHFLL